jgi:acetyl esterase/lipase
MAARPLTLGMTLVLGFAATLRAAEPPAPVTTDLWPAQPPGDSKPIAEEKVTRKSADAPITGITNISKPTLTIYQPEPGKATGAAIVICPGGGYNMLAWDHEGEQIGRWLASKGITGVLLKYRVPRRPDHPRNEPPPQALMDAQRAISVTRARASDLGIDPKRVGILGFSAGGHLGAWASTNFEKPSYEPVDASDKVDRRPDFAVLVYSGGVVKRGTDQLAPEIHVTSQTPPMFLAHAGDDPVTPENSVALYLALKRAGVPAELHIYSKGGHGFGMRPSPNPASTWPARCEEWMRAQGILTSKDAK